MRVPIDISPGLQSNDTPFSSQRSYRNADKMRFYQNRAEVIGGWESISPDYIPGATRDVLPWKDNLGTPLIAYGSSQGLYVLRSGKFVDVTPTDVLPGAVNGLPGNGYGTGGYGKGAYGLSQTPGNYGPRTWSLSNFGQALVASPRNGSLYMWSNDLTKPAAIIANAPTNVAFSMVSQQRQILAFGCNQAADGVYNPLAFRCSDVDGNYTTWTITAQNSADEVVLPSGGALVAARQWGTDLAVWTQAGLYCGVFVGSTTQIWRFDPVDGALGLLGPNAAVVIGQTAYWLTPDFQLYSCVLGSAPVLLECSIRSDSLDNLAPSQQDKVVLSYVASADELRIDYPDVRDARTDGTTGPGLENSRYLSLHLTDGAWSRGTMCRTAFTHGGSFRYPIGAETLTLSLPVRTPIVDLASAQSALATIQSVVKERYGGTNTVLRSNTTASHGAVTSILTGQSGWGVRFMADGTNANSLTISGLSLPMGRACISYRAQVIVGGNASGHVALGSDLSATVALTPAFQLFVHDTINVTDTTDTLTVSFPSGVLKSGAVVELTDFKVETGSAHTLWTPNPSDPALFTAYATFLKSITYPQLVSKHYYHEIGHGADGGALDWYIETNDFAIDSGNMAAMLIREFIPDFRDQLGSVKLTVFMRMSPQDQVEYTAGPFEIDVDTDRIDFLETAKIARFRIEGSGTQAFLRIGTPIFDVVSAGVR